MKPFFLFLLCVGLLVPGLAQRGNGEVTTVQREVPAFDGIVVGGGFEIELTQGDGYAVSVETDANLHDRIEVYVADGLLHVETQGDLRSPTRMRLFIRSEQFARISLSGANELSATTPLYGEALTLKLSGAVSVELAVDYDELVADISGAGSLYLKGKATNTEFSVSGVGSISAYDLLSTLSVVEVSGTGSAKVHAVEALSASVSGMGSIRYQGDPAVRRNLSGMGAISRR